MPWLTALQNVEFALQAAGLSKAAAKGGRARSH